LNARSVLQYAVICIVYVHRQRLALLFRERSHVLKVIQRTEASSKVLIDPHAKWAYLWLPMVVYRPRWAYMVRYH